MARCPDSGCTSWLPGTRQVFGCTFLDPLLTTISAVWFKIAEMGRVGTSNTWGSVCYAFLNICSISDIYQTQFMSGSRTYTYTIPSCLKAGYYLVRHEIIALHSAYSYPGAQFYPSCHQLQVTGSGSSSGPSSKVPFPGAYKSTDPGIKYDMYNPSTYTIPGPAKFSC